MTAHTGHRSPPHSRHEALRAEPSRAAFAGLFFGLAMLTLSACAAVAPPQPPTSQQASTIGVRIALKAVYTPINPSGVVFVRLGPNREYTQPKAVFFSNYIQGQYVFLLNAEPGTYAIVAIVIKSMMMKAVIYLPEPIIDRTIVQVDPGAIAYAGDFLLDYLTNFGETHTDPAQKYYYAILNDKGFHKIDVLDLVLGGFPDFFAPLRAKLPEHRDDKPLDRAAFLAQAREWFASTEWAQRLDN